MEVRVYSRRGDLVETRDAPGSYRGGAFRIAILIVNTSSLKEAASTLFGGVGDGPGVAFHRIWRSIFIFFLPSSGVRPTHFSTLNLLD